jgi:hypothetical protein
MKGISKYLLLWLLFYCFLGLRQPNVYSQSSSTFSQCGGYPILSIDYLNFDCIKDTIMGQQFSNFKYLPKFIKWGKSDTSNCPGNQYHLYDSLKVPVTILEYPNWNNLEGTFALEKYNQDTLYDIILYIKGTTIDTNSGYVNHYRALAIFGQNGIDSIPIIKISEIDSIQSLPFYARNLIMGTDLINPEVRDPSGKKSYKFNRCYLDLSPQDTSEIPPAPIISSIKEDQVMIKVFPNPAIHTLNIEIEQIPAGIYSFKLISLQGNEILNETKFIHDINQYLNSINIKELTAGFYYLIVQKEFKVIGSYSIIVLN